MKPILPNWLQERRILRLRGLLGLLFIFVQRKGLYRVAWIAYRPLLRAGPGILWTVRWGLKRHWVWLPTIKLAADQIFIGAGLAVSGRAASPNFILVYRHMASVIVVLHLGLLQVGCWA